VAQTAVAEIVAIALALKMSATLVFVPASPVARTWNAVTMVAAEIAGLALRASPASMGPAYTPIPM